MTAVLGLAAGLLAGCAVPGEHSARGDGKDPTPAPALPPGPRAEVPPGLAGLGPEDRRLAEAQAFCPVMTDERLGEMGPPLKVVLNGRPVFVCCKGCKKKAEADPARTLAVFEELKAKSARP